MEILVWFKSTINYLSNINCNYIINFDYHDNLIKGMRNLKLKIFSSIKRNWEWVSINSNSKVSYGWIKDLDFNPRGLVSWFDYKKLLSGADVIGWNSLLKKKRKIIIHNNDS